MATLRDDLAAVLGPGNNDQIAYDQADAVLEVLRDYGIPAADAFAEGRDRAFAEIIGWLETGAPWGADIAAAIRSQFSQGGKVQEWEQR